MLKGTYTKLRDQSWGVRIDGECKLSTEIGLQKVSVTKRSGETKTETVRIIWAGKGISLAKIEGSKQATGRRNSGYRRRERYVDDEGCSFPCHTCGKFCRSYEHGYCPNNR